MSLIGQMASASYNAVLAKKRTPANQWNENGFMREWEKQGGVRYEDLGPSIEIPLDYQANPGTVVLATELQGMSLTATEVITSATFTPAELSVPVTWSKRTEATNPSQLQKVAVVKSLLTNGFNSHDNKIEYVMFQAAAVNGLGTLPAYFPTSGQGTVGTVDSSTATWWRHQQNTYVDDTDIESGMTVTWNQATKASGSEIMPTLAVSDASTQAIFEGTQQANQRYIDTDELKAGFKVLGFKTCRYVFSQYASTSIYMFSPKVVYLVVSNSHFRAKGEVKELDNANGYNFNIYSALQLCVENKSRVGNVHL